MAVPHDASLPGDDENVSLRPLKGLDYLGGIIEGATHAVNHKKIDILWDIAREAPKTIASRQKEFIVQLIDEFQFMNAMIYWDKAKTNLAKNLAGGHLSTAESKIAPLLVSGSWVGWLMNLLNSMLPSRFRYEYLENMPEDEAVEMTLPPDVSDAPCRVELIFYCSDPKEEYLETIRRLAHFPHDNKTWLGPGHTMPNGNPPAPLWGSAILDSFLFMPTIVKPDGSLPNQLVLGGQPVHFLWVVPLSSPECDLKLKKGFDAILDLFDVHQHPHVFDTGRKSYV